MRPCSYSAWASFIVLPGEKPRTDEAACCSVDVVNGGRAWRVLGCAFRSETSSAAPARSRRMLFAVSWARISGFLPSKRASLATNVKSSDGFFASTPSR